MKLMVAVPSNRPWVNGFCQSILGLMQYLYTKGVNGEKVHTVFHLQSNASLLPASRQRALDAAIREGFDYMLMLDDDIQFPPNIVDRLIKHNVDFCAINYVTKGLNGRTVAQGANDEKITSAGKTGIEEIGWVGLGCVLLRVAAVKDIPKPHFECIWLEETQSYLGEDLMYCEKLRHHGIKLYIDHESSQLVGHIGDFAFQEKFLPLFQTIL